jgi:hypothetical protein
VGVLFQFSVAFSENMNFNSIQIQFMITQGQLISKCLFDPNSNENIVRISALKFFVASWGLPGSFLGLSGNLVSNIINKDTKKTFGD